MNIEEIFAAFLDSMREKLRKFVQIYILARTKRAAQFKRRLFFKFEITVSLHGIGSRRLFFKFEITVSLHGIGSQLLV